MEDYKEKLRLAKEALDSGSYDKETIEYIFPELKESEDEKIRKELIEYIKANECADYVLFKKFSPDNVIAWLEKQGEQPNKVSIWKHWNNGIAGNGEGKLIYLVKSGNTYRLSSYLSCECDYIELSELDKLYVEKQGEQNHAWSEEDEKMFTLCKLSVRTRHNDGLLTHYEYKLASLWLKSLKERMKGEQGYGSK